MKIIFTGGTGFIGRRLIEKIMSSESKVEVISLIEEKFLNNAKEQKKRLNVINPNNSYEYFIWDIREKKFSKDLVQLIEGADLFCHLAAIYDLAVNKDIGWKINVDGTHNMLELCKSLRSNPIFIYFSTCYVSGRRKGVILEDELTHSAGFKNYYEETKYEAEVVVRNYMNDGLKAIIIRPSIVVGDSKTGETPKFDGVYFVFIALNKFKKLPFGPPKIARAVARVNIVPVDYVVDVSYHLIKNFKNSLGKTFHVCDPMPLVADEFYEICSKKIIGRVPFVSVNKKLFSFTIKFFKKWFPIPSECISYFIHECCYDCSNTLEALKETDISCPHVNQYLDNLIDYFNRSFHI